ncbi:hypothetical protein QYE76_011403 [Lolium multiflorum]|uniref:Transposase (putative) gypsy type domain-containing protein n=1 Tax=Lolium multiflorum TaxID=4521 RepID=A0AAD8TWV5_LOLMU|nr:hypothetical protein QYE76_011403 [Lolium multiflorum]
MLLLPPKHFSMPPRTKLMKHTTPGTNATMDKAEISGWERSKISNQDQKTLKKLGLLKKQDSLIFPSDESFPRPPIGYRVTFIDHLIRGLSTPIHEFLRGLLFVYGIQLHQLTPNSILHISIFITLCECFLGTHPHWGLWKCIFYLRRNNSRNVVYNHLMKHFINLGSESTRFRDEADSLKAEEDALAAKLELSEKAREKAEADVAVVEDLRQRLQTAENALSDKIAQHIERENAIADRFDTQNRKFDNLNIGVEGTIALVAHSQQDVNWTKVGSPKGMNKEKWKALVKDAKPHSKKILVFLSPKCAASASTTKTEVK